MGKLDEHEIIFQKAVCEHCGRPLGPELLNCPECSLGTCPYVVSRSQGIGYPKFGIAALLTGLGIIIIMVIGMDFQWFGILMAALCLLMGMYLSWGQHIVLHNPATGQLWEQFSIFGFPVRYITASPFTQVPPAGQISYALQYPVSVAMLSVYNQQRARMTRAWLDYATDVFYVTLLSLMVQEALELKVITVKKGRFLFSPERMFVLFPGSKISRSQVAGTLENLILQNVMEWSSKSESMISIRHHSYIRKLSHCLTLHDTILLVVQGDWGNPGRKLVSGIVGKDAVQRGLGTMGGMFKNQFKFGDSGVTLLQADYAVAQSLTKKFAAQNSEIAIELRQRIHKALRARVEKDNN